MLLTLQSYPNESDVYFNVMDQYKTFDSTSHSPILSKMSSKLVFLALLLATFSAADHQDDFEAVKKGLVEYFTTGHAPVYFRDALTRYQLPHLFREEPVHPVPFDVTEVCELCNLVVDLVIMERKLGLSRDTLALEAKFVCTRAGIEPERVCDGIIEENIDIFMYIVDNLEDLSSARFCGSVAQAQGCQGNSNQFNWEIQIPEGSTKERPELNETSGENLKIIHLTDIHYDPRYTPGKKSQCDEPLCCQDDQEDAGEGEEACGYWTNYHNGDSSIQLVEEAVRQIKTQEFDYVYFTGDIVSHRVWSTSVEANTETITTIYNEFANFGVPVFPVFGNHEPNPLNVWVSDKVNDEQFSLEWLFTLAADTWGKWLGPESRETILKGGYYTVSPKEGFRIIGINSNLCYNDNWWLIFDDVDPYGQLQWLADTLAVAEENNESVHILGHIPTGSGDCLKIWSQNYRRIIERFSNTITGQFNGHTHQDQLHVHYHSEDPQKAINVAFTGGSLTPFSNNNPSYKIYYVDDTVYTIQDFDSWTFNLTLANSQPNTPNPDWYKLYTFTEAYGTKNIQPAEVGQLVEKMAVDHSLLEDYHRFKYRNSDNVVREGCDVSCQRGELCSIVTFEFGDNTQCEYYGNIFDQNNK